jgi:hypothetical protein
MNDVSAHVRLLVQTSLSVWFVFWAIRRKSESDERLDTSAQIVRWTVVVLSYALTFVPQPELAWVRITFLLIGLAFVAWPNLASGLNRSLRSWTGRHQPREH